jgi:hypothetical protein
LKSAEYSHDDEFGVVAEQTRPHTIRHQQPEINAVAFETARQIFGVSKAFPIEERCSQP